MYIDLLYVSCLEGVDKDVYLIPVLAILYISSDGGFGGWLGFPINRGIDGIG